MSDKPVTKPQDMHATGTTETKAAAGAPQAESGDVTTQDMHATSEPFKPKK